MTVYAVICTVLLLFEHGTVLKTIPDWFVRRAVNVRTMWTGLTWLYDWLNLNISSATNENVGNVISVLISGLLVIGVCVGIGLLLIQSVRNVQDVWRRMNLQRKAVSIALMAAAILVGIVCAEKIMMVPINVIS